MKLNKNIKASTYLSEYKVWHSMKRRCYEKNNNAYHNYGGRGIKVCDRWLNSFENFFRDIGEIKNGLTLDRIDNDGNYCKENCRLATRKQQARNTRRNRMITYKGKTMCVAEWSEKLNISYGSIFNRLLKGWSVEDIFEIPIGGKTRLTKSSKIRHRSNKNINYPNEDRIKTLLKELTSKTNKTVNLKLKQIELADYLKISRQCLNGNIKRFNEKGNLKFERTTTVETLELIAFLKFLGKDKGFINEIIYK